MLKKIHQFIADIVSQAFLIKPFANVLKVSRNSWQSISADPQLTLKSPLFRKGWYAVNMRVDFISHNQIQVAKIYPDYGTGFSEETAIVLPHRHVKTTYKVIYLKRKPKTLRFDPVEDKIDFNIEELKFYPLSKKTACQFMLERVHRLHPKYNKLSKKEVEGKLLHHIDSLQTSVFPIYNDTFSTSHSDINYQSWIFKRAQEQEYYLESIAEKTNANHLVSILLPTYNSNTKYLKSCIDSVLQQTYSRWQLCIVDDGSTQTEHLDLIQSYVAQDPRIQFYQKPENTHICDTTNACLKMAKGSYTLFLDHDDMLAPHALLIMMSKLQWSPELCLIYADEDKVDTHNIHFAPHFKPEWNPDLLYSQNYIGHPVLLETEKLKSIGGVRKGFEGSQDHDLLLRYTASLSSHQIHRIPDILYHWRAHDESTALDLEAKDYTTAAGIKALENHFHNQNKGVSISQGKFPNTYKVNWEIPHPAPLVSLIVPTHNGYDILKNCINSILDKTTYSNYEVLIIDNKTTCPKTLRFIQDSEDNNIHVRSLKWEHPFNFSAINNYAVSQAKGSIVGLINNDIEVISPDWLTEMVSHAARPEIGCVGAKLYYPNNTIQHAGVILGLGGVAGHSHKHFPKASRGYFDRLSLIQNLSAVTAACLIVEKKIYNQVGGLDEKNLPIAFNDVDFCIKVRQAGYRNLWTPYAELYHHESISRGSENTPEKRKRADKEILFMKEKWKDHLIPDPAYSPNLTLDAENFSLKV